jgi:hypothetical protein
MNGLETDGFEPFLFFFYIYTELMTVFQIDRVLCQHDNEFFAYVKGPRDGVPSLGM